MLAASDDDFADTWPRLTQEQQGAIPDAQRRACFIRYGKLTPWVHASTERLRREQSVTQTKPLQEATPFVDSVTLIDGASITPEAVQWLWEGFLARGKLHVLAGAPGTHCESGNVLIWSAEDDIADTLVPRLIAMGADMGRIQFVGDRSTMDGRAPFDPSRDMPMLMRAIAVTGEIKLLIVDPIVSAVAGDSHKNAEVRRGLQPLVDAGMLPSALPVRWRLVRWRAWCWRQRNDQRMTAAGAFWRGQNPTSGRMAGGLPTIWHRAR